MKDGVKGSESALVMILPLAAHKGDSLVKDLVLLRNATCIKQRHRITVSLIGGIKKEEVRVLLKKLKTALRGNYKGKHPILLIPGVNELVLASLRQQEVLYYGLTPELCS